MLQATLKAMWHRAYGVSEPLRKTGKLIKMKKNKTIWSSFLNYENSKKPQLRHSLTPEHNSENSKVLLCKRLSLIEVLGIKRNGTFRGSLAFRHPYYIVVTPDNEEEEKSKVAFRKIVVQSLINKSDVAKPKRKHSYFFEDDKKPRSKASCELALSHLSPTTQRKLIGRTVKRHMLRKSNSFDGSVTAKDEGEKEMSMASSYKFSKEPIGLGAFGTCVYSGVNTKDGRKVAIKKINCHTQNQTRQYKREVKYLLLLSGCPNIVKYLDVEVGQNVVYIMLELMEGTLETLVNQPNLNLKFTEMCQDIISALDFLHNKTNKTIVHRDIKPRNILFVSSPRLKLKLADFGLSKMLDSDSSSIGYNGGTRCWMAPEVHRSLDQFSTASDVFAAGLVVHYLMSSKHPFAPVDVTCNKDNRLLVEHDIVHNILKKNLKVDSSLSPEAAHLTVQMLKDKRDQRPKANEMLAHPFFWPVKKKIQFLEATANQPEIFQKGSGDFKKDLESTQLGAQFRKVPWSKKSPTMVYVYNEMMVAGRRKYNTTSVAELLRFMRNAYQHVSEPGHASLFQQYLLKDFVFFKEFKALFIVVYDVVLKHEWDQNKEEIMYAMS